MKAGDKEALYPTEAAANKGAAISIDRGVVIRVFAVIFLTTALGGIIFQSTTYALPKFFELRLQDIAAFLTLVGVWSAFVFAMAAFAQLVVRHLEDKHSTRTIFALVTATQAVLLAIMINMFGTPALIILLAFILVVIGQILINDVLVGRVARRGWRSRTYAARSFVTFSVMFITLPSIAWLLNNRGTFEWAPSYCDQFAAVFVILAVAAALISLLVLQLPKVAAITGVYAKAAEQSTE